MADSDNRTYISILSSSLEEKKKVLLALKEETIKQSDILAVTPLDADAFDSAVTRKSKLLESLTRLDEGFDEVYKRVAEELKLHKDDYRAEIEHLQRLIGEITPLGTELERLENCNKTRLEMVLSAGRKKIKDFKISNKTAAAYYRNMSGTHQDGQSYFCDKKK